MGAVATDRLQVVACLFKAVGLQQLSCALVINFGPLQLEEDELRFNSCRQLLNARHQRAVGWVFCVGCEAKVRVVSGAAYEVADDRQLSDGQREARAVKLADLAGVGGGQRGGAAVGVGEQLVAFRWAASINQIFKLPSDVIYRCIAHRARIRATENRCRQVLSGVNSPK